MDMASFLGDQTLLGTAERGRGERAQSAPKTKDSQQHKEGPRLHGAYDRSISIYYIIRRREMCGYVRYVVVINFMHI